MFAGAQVWNCLRVVLQQDVHSGFGSGAGVSAISLVALAESEALKTSAVEIRQFKGRPGLISTTQESSRAN
jgi:hypothetical protein